MDDRERIARVEAYVDAHSKQFDRIDQSLRDLHDHTVRGFAEQRSYIDHSIEKLREHTDRGFAEQRAYIDHSLEELRDRTDRGFAELRSEMTKMTRWMIGITVSYGIAIVGILAKAAFGP